MDTEFSTEEVANGREQNLKNRIFRLLSDNQLHKTYDISYITGIGEDEVLQIARKFRNELKLTEPQLCLSSRPEIVSVDPNGLRAGSIKESVFDVVNQSKEPMNAYSIGCKLERTTDNELNNIRTVLNQLFKAEMISRVKRGVYVPKGWKMTLSAVGENNG